MPNPRFSLLKNGHGCIFEINKDDEEYHLKLNGVIGNGSASEIFQTKEMELKFAYLKKK